MNEQNLSIPSAIIMAGVIIAGAVLLSSGGTVSPSPSAPETREINIAPIQAEDHIRGERDAKILLVEYSDLECPFCKTFHQTIKQVSEKESGVAWVYRHFPLPFHTKAPKEAEAAECAWEQGGDEAFWKYIDAIFAKTPANNGLDPAELPKTATEIGIDAGLLTKCLNSGKYGARIDAHIKDGSQVGVSGTPYTVIWNTKTGKKTSLVGAQNAQALEQAIKSVR